MNTLHDIEKSCTRLATARAALSAKVSAAQAEMDEVRRRHRTGIRRALDRVQALTEETRGLVGAAPELFQKPKSVELAGIKVGFQQGKSRLEIPDVERTCELIRRHLSEPENFLVVEERPVRAALAQLPVAMRRKVGVELIEGSDEPIVRPQDGDLESLCKTVLGE